MFTTVSLGFCFHHKGFQDIKTELQSDEDDNDPLQRIGMLYIDLIAEQGIILLYNLQLAVYALTPLLGAQYLQGHLINPGIIDVFGDLDKVVDLLRDPR